MSKVYAEIKKEKREADAAKSIAKNKARKAARDMQSIQEKLESDIIQEANSRDELLSFPVTKTDPTEIVTAVEVKRMVSFTHPIDIFVVRASASMEMSIVHNIFLKNFRLI
jgi:hypothetical protein